MTQRPSLGWINFLEWLTELTRLLIYYKRYQSNSQMKRENSCLNPIFGGFYGGFITQAQLIK